MRVTPPRIKLSEQPEEVRRELVVNPAHDVFMRRDAGGRTTCLGFQTHFQRKLMRKFGLEREVILDVCDTLELNGMKLMMLLILDNHRVRHPVAFCLTREADALTMFRWLGSIQLRLRGRWRPSCVITNVCLTQIAVVKLFWGGTVPTVLASSEVKALWRRSRALAGDTWPSVFLALRRLVGRASAADPGLDPGPAKEEALAAVRAEWAAIGPDSAWVDYFEREWVATHPPETWMDGLRAAAPCGPDLLRQPAAVVLRAIREKITNLYLRDAKITIEQALDVLGAQIGESAVWIVTEGCCRRNNLEQAADVMKSVRAARRLAPEHVRRPGPGERLWTVGETRPFRVDPTDALGCACHVARRRVACPHVLAALMAQEPELTDRDISTYLGKAWGTPFGNVESMLRTLPIRCTSPGPMPEYSVWAPEHDDEVLEPEDKAAAVEPSRRSRRSFGLPLTMTDFDVAKPRRVPRSRLAELPAYADFPTAAPKLRRQPEFKELVQSIRDVVADPGGTPLERRLGPGDAACCEDLRRLWRQWNDAQPSRPERALLQWALAAEAVLREVQSRDQPASKEAATHTRAAPKRRRTEAASA